MTTSLNNHSTSIISTTGSPLSTSKEDLSLEPSELQLGPERAPYEMAPGSEALVKGSSSDENEILQNVTSENREGTKEREEEEGIQRVNIVDDGDDDIDGEEKYIHPLKPSIEDLDFEEDARPAAQSTLPTPRNISCM